MSAGRTTRRGTSYALALLAGLMLFASDHPVHHVVLQLFAYYPFWAALLRERVAGRALWPVGLLLAIGYVTPLLAAVGTAPPLLVAGAAAALQWPIAAMLAGRLIDRGRVLGPLGAAAALTLTEVAVWYLVPMFGTAQCCVRPLSAMPFAVGFVAYTGVGGLVFVLTAMQALGARANTRPFSWRPTCTALALVGLALGADVVRWTRELGPTVRVATVGWHGTGTIDRDFHRQLFAWFDAASKRGAQVLVTPETGAHVGAAGWGWQTRDDAAAFLGGLCREHRIAAVIGLWIFGERDNRAWLLDRDGALVGEYTKTHLIPWLESYNAGDGTIATAALDDGALMGAMICQDDNFTDLGRRYGDAGARVVAVPTNDWPAIREYHLENGVFRAIENGYAVVRAASHGVSAIVSARGEVVARRDHVDGGDHLMVHDVAIGDGRPTLYARLGDLPIAAVCLLLVGLAAAQRRPTATLTSA